MIFVDRGSVPVPEICYSKMYEKAELELHSIFSSGSIKQTRFKPNYKIIQGFMEPLQALFQDRCAYCEIPLKGMGVIDQFRPIQTDDIDAPYPYWYLAYKWENQYLSCATCNRLKANNFPLDGKREIYEHANDPKYDLLSEKPLLMDPCLQSDFEPPMFNYAENGAVHIKDNIGAPPLMRDKARVTIELLGLNRMELVEARMSLIDESRKYGEDFKINPIRGFLELQYFLKAAFPLPETDIRQTDSTEKNITLSDKIESALADSYFSTSDTKARRLIERVELHDFKSIEHLDIAFPTATDSEVEPWMIIIGENGVGKSSILQGLGLALSGQKYLDELKSTIEPHSLIRKGRRKAQVKVYLVGERNPIVLTVTKDNMKVNAAKAPMLVLGYGATRMFPKPDSEPSDSGYRPNLENLFDHWHPLKNVEPWLADPRSVTPRQFDRIAALLKDLLLLNKEGDSERLFRRRAGRITFNRINSPEGLFNLCDGYRSVLAYALDIMMSVQEVYPNIELAKGVVLIDEIETHLHPSWKIKIIDLLRDVFPQLNFVVTTHDPLCLRGAKEGEVHVMKFDTDKQQIDFKNYNVPPGIAIDELLMGVWFQMGSTFDQETNQLLERYNHLLLQVSEPEAEAEREELEQQISKRLSHVPKMDKASLSNSRDLVKHLMKDVDKSVLQQPTKDIAATLRARFSSKLKSKD